MHKKILLFTQLNMIFSKAFVFGFFVFAFLVLTSACTTHSVPKSIQTGEIVLLEYTCRLNTGELVMTTDEELANNSSEERSVIFMPRKTYGTVEVVAGEELEKQKTNRSSPLEVAIDELLAKDVVGFTREDTYTLQIPAKLIPRHAEGNQVLPMARVRKRPKEMKFSTDYYKRRWKKEPHIHDEVAIDPAFPGMVTAINGNEVVVHFEADEGQIVETDLGQGIVHEHDDHYLIDIQAQLGHIVRTGPLVGRIVRVTDRMVTIDYSHPSGGESLCCEVFIQ